MSEFRKIIKSFPSNISVEPDDEVVLEVILKKPSESFGNILEPIIPPDVIYEVNQAFDDEKTTKFYFLKFPEIPATGYEHFGFELARELKKEIGAEEVNFLGRGHFYGGTAAFDGGTETYDQGALESSLVTCETKRNDQLPKAWAHSFTNVEAHHNERVGAGVSIAVIDTGASEHDELADVFNIGAGINLIEKGLPPLDVLSEEVKRASPGHGSLVASVIASRGGLTNDQDTSGPGKITGIAPSAKIIPIRAIRSVVDIRLSRIAGAIKHAIKQDADIITMCLGSPFGSRSVKEALQLAVDAGIIVICAAGNCYGPVVFPARYASKDLAIAVAAVTHRKYPWRYTSMGRSVTISSPGEHVWGATYLDGDERRFDLKHLIRPSQGTTLATSVTSGIAALWLSHHGKETIKNAAAARGQSVLQLFRDAITSDLTPPSEWNGSDELGAGIIDATKTLAYDIFNTRQQDAILVSRVNESMGDVFLNDADDKLGLTGNEPDFAEFANELVWNSFMSQAQERAEPPLETGLNLDKRTIKKSISLEMLLRNKVT